MLLYTPYKEYYNVAVSCPTILDRLVLLGNHRDAWTYGAADPSSGQAVLLEIGRALGVMKKKGI